MGNKVEYERHTGKWTGLDGLTAQRNGTFSPPPGESRHTKAILREELDIWEK